MMEKEEILALVTAAVERRMFGIQELAEYLGVSRQSIYNRLSAGTFPIKTKRLGRRISGIAGTWTTTWTSCPPSTN